jgi:outer membrane protein assembly factor BamB
VDSGGPVPDDGARVRPELARVPRRECRGRRVRRAAGELGRQGDAQCRVEDTDNGILTAYDAKTGQRIYRSRVSDAAGRFSASPVAANGHIYLAGEDGDIFVVKAGRQFQLVSTNPMGEIAMATPAIAGTMPIVRTQGLLFGIAAS